MIDAFFDAHSFCSTCSMNESFTSYKVSYFWSCLLAGMDGWIALLIGVPYNIPE